MKTTYDKYYEIVNLFGEAYPELIAFFVEYTKKGRVLDLGCGQGRDAIALARPGYAATGLDNSQVGIDQMNEIGKNEKLNLVGQVQDIYTYDRFSEFDIILLDSMFHFAKKDKEKEIGLLEKIVSEMTKRSLLVVYIQDTDVKVQTLKNALNSRGNNSQRSDKSFSYVFKDSESRHISETAYRMIVFER